MIRNLLKLIFLTLSIQAVAQKNYNSSSMVVSIADLENTTFENDTTANAFCIYEKGYSRIENGRNYNLLTDYERKIKILNKQGFEEATVEVVLYENKSSKQLLRDLVAYTHNIQNGTVVKTKVEKQHIFKEVYDENYTITKFTFPNVKPGAVITYKYQIESPFIRKFKGWDFQDDIPKLYSEYVADLPGNYQYNIKLVGNLKLDTDESKIIRNCIEVSNGGKADCAHHVYVMKNIPAFKEEKYMTAKENYFSKIDYELKEVKGFDGINKKYTETWKNVDLELKSQSNIGLQLKKINATKDILPDSIKSLPTTLVKAKKIYNYITKHYKWNGKYEFFKTNSKNGEVKNVISTQIGNVFGINILAHNILKQQGFTVQPVLLSTRENGYATKLYPILTDFNYLIIRLSIDSTSYLIDATENTLAFGQLPFRCLNQYGRLLDFKNGSSWIDIKPNNITSRSYQESIAINSDLEPIGRARRIFSGYAAHDRRKAIQQVDLNEYAKQIKRFNPEYEVEDVIVKNRNNTEKKYQEEFKFVGKTESIDNIIYLKPFLTPFFEENPFKLKERTYPVDFGYPDSYSYYVTITLPDGYDFIDLPKSSKLKIPNNLGSVITAFSANNGKLNISHRINFNSAYYPTEYYKALKEILNIIVELENNTLIAFKKVN